MSIFDRFSSQKGKGEKGAKPSVTPKKKGANKATEAKKEAYKAVPAATEEKKGATPAPSAKATGVAHRVLLSAVVTEKSAMLEKHRQYVFSVAADATKKTVTEAVQSVYGVRPEAVNIVRLPGKWVRYGRTTGKQVLRKKAIVTLPSGKTIDVVSA